MADFTKLEQIFTMMTPADLAGKVKLNLGGQATEITGGSYEVLQSIIDNDARGVMTIEDIITKFNGLTTNAGEPSKDDLKKFFDFHSSKGQPSFVGDDSKMYMTKDGPKKISGVAQIIGADFKLPPNFNVLLMNSRSPFFNPAKRHTKRVELFLNSMPSVILGQMVPYLDIEFQVTKAPTTGLPYLGQLRFLLGNVEPPKDGANKAMLDGHRTFKKDQEYDYAGMEMFTSPQTLVDPTPNVASAGRQARYAEIADPFRPFASIESLTISAKPTVGMMTFKKASLVIKLHDRARLSEISDLIRPQAFGNVTVWLTYGWRAPQIDPSGPTGVPYFEFINNNMMMREAYGVSNASFSFDNVGQVTINLELFTKGGQELKTISITDGLDSKGKETAGSLMKKIKLLSEEIARYRKRLKLDPPEGINKEIRAYQILDAASTGEFPDMKATEVEAAITQLSTSLKGTANIDTDAAKKLIDSLKTLYSKDQDQTKFSLKQRIATLATQEVAERFKEVMTGPDPYLMDESKTAEKATSPLILEIKKYQGVPKGKIVDKWQKKIVSFGKLFSVFVLNCIIPSNVTEELQVFFYSLNDQCGPISGHSIAEFPIDMEVFLDQYRDYVVRRGGENITIDEFLALVVNAQILDNRAVGYGLRSYYESYHPGKDITQDKNKEKEFESVLAKWAAQYGPFKKPAIEMFVETTHQRTTTEGQADVLQQLAYSAKDASAVFNKDVQGDNFKRIMRIHIYDKQVNPYKTAAMLLKNEDGHGFVEAPSTPYAQGLSAKEQVSDLSGQVTALKGLSADIKSGKAKMTEFTNAREVKDQVSKMVPTLTYGANGTTIISANLSTRAEPLLSTINMQRSNTTKNTAQPNGSGEGGIPLRVIPAQLTMTTLGCPLAAMAQMYFIDFNTGTSIDNLYICTALQHVLAAGKFETQWTFGYSDAYGVFEGAPNIIDQITKLSADIPKKP